MLTLLALATGCTSTEPEGGPTLEPDTFIEVVIELRQADHETRTLAEFERRRARILENHGVTVDELRRFVEVYSRDVARLSAVWDTIEDRLRKRPEPDSVPPPTDRLPSPADSTDGGV